MIGSVKDEEEVAGEKAWGLPQREPGKAAVGGIQACRSQWKVQGHQTWMPARDRLVGGH